MICQLWKSIHICVLFCKLFVVIHDLTHYFTMYNHLLLDNYIEPTAYITRVQTKLGCNLIIIYSSYILLIYAQLQLVVHSRSSCDNIEWYPCFLDLSCSLLSSTDSEITGLFAIPNKSGFECRLIHDILYSVMSHSCL